LMTFDGPKRPNAAEAARQLENLLTLWSKYPSEMWKPPMQKTNTRLATQIATADITISSGNSIRVSGSIFRGTGRLGDFAWMIKRPEYARTLFVYNDNEEAFDAFQKDRINGACSAGAGNAIIRPYQCLKKQAIGVPTGSTPEEGAPMEGYKSLDGHAKRKIDQAIASILELAQTGNYDMIKFSQAASGNTLGAGTFKVAEEVKNYIFQSLLGLGAGGTASTSTAGAGAGAAAGAGASTAAGAGASTVGADAGVAGASTVGADAGASTTGASSTGGRRLAPILTTMNSGLMYENATDSIVPKIHGLLFTDNLIIVPRSRFPTSLTDQEVHDFDFVFINLEEGITSHEFTIDRTVPDCEKLDEGEEANGFREAKKRVVPPRGTMKGARTDFLTSSVQEHTIQYKSSLEPEKWTTVKKAFQLPEGRHTITVREVFSNGVQQTFSEEQDYKVNIVASRPDAPYILTFGHNDIYTILQADANVVLPKEAFQVEETTEPLPCFRHLPDFRSVQTDSRGVAVVIQTGEQNPSAPLKKMKFISVVAEIFKDMYVYQKRIILYAGADVIKNNWETINGDYIIKKEGQRPSTANKPGFFSLPNGTVSYQARVIAKETGVISKPSSIITKLVRGGGS